MIAPRKKLIEVALPLEAINAESAREKSIRHGHPSTLHLWWARRPLAACRAILFAQLVDDPSVHPDRFPTEEAQQAERERLFRIIEQLVKWENIQDQRVLNAARKEILRSCDGNPPPVLDPFCGGGSIPLEAQRLGLEAHGGDLNPVAVLITKALIEIPPRFADLPPVNPDARRDLNTWTGAQGLADDVRWYGNWMREKAEQHIGHLYPKAQLPPEHGGGDATVIAWIWARTVTCPNPACGATMPLVRSFWLSKKKGKQAWVEPVIDRAAKKVTFTVCTGSGSAPESTVERTGARCLVCESPVPLAHVRSEGKAGRIGQQLMAIAAEGNRTRVYLDATDEQESVAGQAKPAWRPEGEIAHDPRAITTPNYGMTHFADLFTDRQLTALTTFSDLITEARDLALKHAVDAGLPDGDLPLVDGGAGATAYADAVCCYLCLGVSRMTDINNALCRWENTKTQVRNLFSRQTISMVWDFAENNVFAGAAGDYKVSLGNLVKVIEKTTATAQGRAYQCDATSALNGVVHPLVATDPPYYDNIGYADLSDFFYVWLRQSLADVFPSLFSTLLTPKSAELVANPYRFDGDRKQAESFFEEGLGRSFAAMREAHAPDYPMTVIYAFKQSESGNEGTASTGWETMLAGLLNAGFAITGTWPIRSELSNRPRGLGWNALASSIVLACRPREADAGLGTRKDFVAALRAELPEALRLMQQGNLAPVDLAQASIGPGMAVFSRYAKVLEADGSPMRVRSALELINQVLDEVLAEQEGEFDGDTRWAVSWFSQYGTEPGAYGVAETLSKAKNTAVDGLVQAGIAEARGGKVRLLSRGELNPAWDPATEARLTVWEITQHLIRTLESEGESGAAALLNRVGGLGEAARDLAYRLYSVCERKGWASEALGYNALVASWPEIAKLAGQTVNEQTALDLS